MFVMVVSGRSGCNAAVYATFLRWYTVRSPPPLPAFFVSGKDLPVLRVGIRGQIRNVHSSAHELENLTARPASHSSYSQVVCCEVFPCIDVDLQIIYHYLKPTQIPFRLEPLTSTRSI